jgi:hypothetical protein
MKRAGVVVSVVGMLLFATDAQASRLIFDRGQHRLTLLDRNGNVLGQWLAYNNIGDRPRFNPDESLVRPFPDGTWTFAYPKAHPENVVSFGRNGILVFNVPGRSGLGVHSGRNGPESITDGCIRTTDQAMATIIKLMQSGDPLTTITVENQDFSRLAALAAKAPWLNLQILYWTSVFRGQQVGDGQCWAMVPQILQQVGGEIPGVFELARRDDSADWFHRWHRKAIVFNHAARPDALFVLVAPVSLAEPQAPNRDEAVAVVGPGEPAYAGDVVHFQSARFEQADGAYYITAEHHWAIIWEVHAHRTFTLIHQNWNGIQTLHLLRKLNFANLKTGTVTILRPKRLPGRLTFDAEGTEGGAMHSRRLQFRGGQSGVTIGRGYHMKGRTHADVVKDLTAAGLKDTLAAAYAAGAGLSGQDALEFVRRHEYRLQEITRAQQRKLFLIDYPRHEKVVRDLYETYQAQEGGWKVSWDRMDSTIKEVMVDVQYSTGFTPEQQHLLVSLIAANHLEAFATILLDRSQWKNVPADRFKRRAEFLENALLAWRATPSIGVATKAASYVGKTLGDGLTTTFVQEAAGLPPAVQWQRGIRVRGETLPKGIAIAVFSVESSRPGSEKSTQVLHASIYDGQDESGIWVYDQLPGEPVQRRHVRFQQGRTQPWRDGNAFHVVVGQSMAMPHVTRSRPEQNTVASAPAADITNSSGTQSNLGWFLAALAAAAGTGVTALGGGVAAVLFLRHRGKVRQKH